MALGLFPKFQDLNLAPKFIILFLDNKINCFFNKKLNLKKLKVIEIKSSKIKLKILNFQFGAKF